MFARSEKAKQQVQKSWNATISRRTHIGVVVGEVAPPGGTITSWLTERRAFIVYSSQKQGSGKRAVTYYKKVVGNDTLSMLQNHLETGREQQVRVHIQDLDHPVIGDKIKLIF
jgi:23S rRNA pseudouridine1911/1915/1917 synthase